MKRRSSKEALKWSFRRSNSTSLLQSEEDLEIKQKVDLCVQRVQDSDLNLQKLALDSLRQEISISTSSMTSVPNPLKFLRAHYGTLKAHYETMADLELKKYLANILSVLAFTMSEKGEQVHLIHGWKSADSCDPFLDDLAATFVNAFVNAGFGQDTLMTILSESSSGGSSGSWIFKHERASKEITTASLGMILLWDVDEGLAKIDEYFESNDNDVTAGALLAVGIVTCGIKSENAPLAFCKRKSHVMISMRQLKTDFRVGKIFWPSLALLVTPFSIGVGPSERLYYKENNEIRMGAIMGLGLAYAGSQNEQENVKKTMENSKAFPENIHKCCCSTLQSLAYAGTGDVLKVQKFLRKRAQLPEEGDIHQGPAVIGIGLLAMAEELGIDMAIRSMEHLLKHGEHNIRKAVPLALALLCISDPKVDVIDTLSRVSHDTDLDVALVRIAQGLVHLGRGLLTLAPCHSDRFLLSPTRLAGIVTMLYACLDIEILGSYLHVFYFLVLAMHPRMPLTVDEKLKPLAVQVCVGQAVDVAGQAGRGRTITGFQTLSTPVLIAAGERAELATEKYIPLSSILKGFVILKENPDYREEH